MGRKRKTVAGSTIANEDKISSACPGITSDKEKLDVHADNTNTTETMNSEQNVKPNSKGLPANEKKSRYTNGDVRRSGRLKSSVLPSESQGLEPVVEHVNLAENEKEQSQHSQQVQTSPVLEKKQSEVEPHVQQEVEPHVQQEVETQVPQEVETQVQQVTDVKERNLEEQVDHHVQEADGLNSEVIKSFHEGHSRNFSYKRLYIESQKKIEALIEENYELVKKLEFTLGKVEAYEKMSVALGPSKKEVLLVTSVGKTNEATVSLSNQQVQECINPPAAAAAAAADATPDDVAVDDSKNNKKNKRKAKKGW